MLTELDIVKDKILGFDQINSVSETNIKKLKVIQYSTVSSVLNSKIKSNFVNATWPLTAIILWLHFGDSAFFNFRLEHPSAPYRKLSSIRKDLFATFFKD
ncbi:hypothetical protein BpHYR1_032656 [Brachionus plicatilis]|uniref:Uncharacterized protein n=1 Tax=Brachionus plicatilis TaxID=10195 RepID=A0A3M7RE07_BRAPC|nr:hypothetical protein BpHYR1_032656 [Brachionus plicatilis]